MFDVKSIAILYILFFDRREFLSIGSLKRDWLLILRHEIDVKERCISFTIVLCQQSFEKFAVK
jgi:hypothetical protein